MFNKGSAALMQEAPKDKPSMAGNSAAPHSPRSSKPRILFVAEAVTLAHVARAFALMQSLDRNEFDACLACDPRYDRLLSPAPFSRRPIASISSERFVEALAKGAPIFDLATLRGYAREDLEVIDDFRPDLIVGDCRLSLAVSAEVARIPFVSITNAYWSPHSGFPIPMPELPLTRLVGVRLARPTFRLTHRLVMSLHTIPLNKLRAEYGLSSLGKDLREIYSHSDRTLFADVPQLYPNCKSLPDECWLGPVNWSPAVPLPEWWNDLPNNRPIVYVTLGSSGRHELAATTLKALADVNVTVLCATLGRLRADQLPRNAFAGDYLPGEQAAARSNLVVCNGGSPTTQQAFAAGVPVLGIAGNMDQHLNMQAVSDFGAGLLLRSEHAHEPRIRHAAETLLRDQRAATRARELQGHFAAYDAPARFRSCVARMLAARSVTSW